MAKIYESLNSHKNVYTAALCIAWEQPQLHELANGHEHVEVNAIAMPLHTWMNATQLRNQMRTGGILVREKSQPEAAT